MRFGGGLPMRAILFFFCVTAAATTAMADEVGITKDIMSVTVQTPDGSVEIMRN
jgi:hypothetical protein